MQLAVEMELDVLDIPDRGYHPTTPEILDSLLRRPLSNSTDGHAPSHTESRFAVGLSVRPDYFQSETEGNRSDQHRSRT